MFSWRTYHSSLFVNRPEALDEIRRWADAKEEVEKRLLSLVGPPGSGKTWILKKLLEGWKEKKRFVAYLNVPEIIDSAEKTNRDRIIDVSAFDRWLNAIFDEAKRHCPSIPPISSLADISARVGKLAELLCQCSLDWAPLVIVDGYDEISETQAEVVSLRILSHLIERTCMRLLIAHRAEQTLQGDSLRRAQKWLYLPGVSPLTQAFALQQFTTLFQTQHAGVPVPSPKTWLDQLHEYRWNHPFVNHFLFERGLRGTTALHPLNSQDFYDCIQAAISRPDEEGQRRYPPLSEAEFRILHRIATELPEHWLHVQVEDLLSVNFYRDSKIGRLYNLGVIVLDSPDRPFYRIADGLGELLRETDLTQVAFLKEGI